MNVIIVQKYSLKGELYKIYNKKYINPTKTSFCLCWYKLNNWTICCDLYDIPVCDFQCTYFMKEWYMDKFYKFNVGMYKKIYVIIFSNTELVNIIDYYSSNGLWNIDILIPM